MAAVAATQDIRNKESAPNLTDIHLISFGSGTNLSYVKGRNHDWGADRWAGPLISLLHNASTGVADFQCRQILKDTYRRIAPVFYPDTNINLDEWERSKELLAFGNACPLTDSWSGADVVEWLKQVRW